MSIKIRKISAILILLIVLQIIGNLSISLADGEPELKIDVNNAIIQISNQEFTGSEVKPEVRVIYNNSQLSYGTDFTVEYRNNVSAGTAIAEITGIGAYTGTVTKRFQITPKSIKKLKIDVTEYYTYTGEKRNATIKIYDNNKKLKIDTDYKLDYKNNIKTGKATVKIQGKGNFSGSIDKNYFIVPKKAKIKKIIMNSKFTKATITWEKDSTATGYSIYMATSKEGNYTKIKNIKDKKTTEYVAKNLNPKKTYYFKVRSYKLINDKKVYSKSYSNAKTNTELLAEVKLTSTSNSKNRNTNLAQASKAINGLVLKPGESFNWFRVVGPTSAKKGYKVAAIFKDKKHAMGMGGGICQVSTTLYQAALKAKLKIIERHQHSLPVTYTTLGKDATVTYGANNLIIRNNKKYAIKLVTTAKNNSTTCKIYKVNY